MKEGDIVIFMTGGSAKGKLARGKIIKIEPGFVKVDTWQGIKKISIPDIVSLHNKNSSLDE